MHSCAKTSALGQREMRKELRHELEVATSADSIWAVYGSADIPTLLRDVLLPGVFERMDVIQGTGGVGTVLDIAFRPGAIHSSYKEKLVEIDHKNRLKEVEMIEGGYLDQGCNFYMDRIHVLEKGSNSCVIKSTLIYEVPTEFAESVGLLISIKPIARLAEVISNYVLKQMKVTDKISRKELTHELAVATSADSIWAVYGSPDMVRLLRDVLFPDFFERLEIVEGDGGVGTILDMVFPPGNVPRTCKEKFVKVDHENRLKEVMMIGGYLDLGCTSYMARFHVLEKGPNACILKSTIIYEVMDEFADSIGSLISIEEVGSMAQVISDYVLEHRYNVSKKILRKEQLTHEFEVAASADDVWAVYSSPDIPRLLRDVLLPGMYERLDVVEGDGEVGTVLDFVLAPGFVPHAYKERFVKIDHDKRLKEVVMIEGGYLNLGCTFYMDRIYVLDKGPTSCIIQSSLIYEVPDDHNPVNLITTKQLAMMAEVVADYVLNKPEVISVWSCDN